jgi:hypothetical protein
MVATISIKVFKVYSFIKKISVPEFVMNCSPNLKNYFTCSVLESAFQFCISWDLSVIGAAI